MGIEIQAVASAAVEAAGRRTDARRSEEGACGAVERQRRWIAYVMSGGQAVFPLVGARSAAPCAAPLGAGALQELGGLVATWRRIGRNSRFEVCVCV